MKISIIGSGYVGLVSGVCLAEKGHNVCCVDKEPEKVQKINDGICPIFEAGLHDLLEKNLHTKFKAKTDLADAVINSETTIIAVGTPFDGKTIDLSYIKKATIEIAKALKEKTGYHLVVVKSTVTPGTTDNLVKTLLDDVLNSHTDLVCDVAMNPEFLREGNAVSDFLNPDRIVLGANNEQAMKVLRRLYKVFPNVEIFETNCKTAEMIKYTSNSLLATMISFSNEIANLCSNIQDVDILDVMSGVRLDRRLSPELQNGQRIFPDFLSYLQPGCGFGGSCFPKDLKALASFGKKNQAQMKILEAVVAVNQNQPNQIIKILNNIFPSLNDKRISVLGFSFKPGTDDIRESPALPITEYLIKKGANLFGYDPVAKIQVSKIFDKEEILFEDDLEKAIIDKDAIIIVTQWPEFNGLPKLLKRLNQTPKMIDGRRMLDKNDLAWYHGIGVNHKKN